mgnify:CR=1 FL=1|tara:strand:+ start:71 stop:796 length:726 start_codon:yes stop_codon:yes gene_type:complete
MTIGVYMGIAQGVGSLFGMSSRRHAAKAEAARQHALMQQQAANAAAKQAYGQKYDEIMTEVYNERTIEEFDIKLANYEEQLAINRDAAHGSYAAEQFRFNEQMEQATLNRNRMYKELLQVQGQQAARGGAYSKSRERADLINSVAAYGVEQTEFDKTLYSAKSAHNQRLGAIAAQHQNADYTAWTQIAIAPRLKLPGQQGAPKLTNVVGPQKVSTGIGFGDVLGAAASGVQFGMGIDKMFS